MKSKMTSHYMLVLAALIGMTTFIHSGQAQKPVSVVAPTIPKTWDDEALASLEVPLAEPAASAAHISSDYYYRIPVRPIYRQYPVYAPGKEPPGYMDWLKQQEPEIVWGDTGEGKPGRAPALKTEADWIKAGEIVFDASLVIGPRAGLTVQDVRDPALFAKAGVPVTREGTVPFYFYVIRKKGEVELGGGGCATCHSRVMPDGTVVKGAQGNFPADRAFANVSRRLPAERLRLGVRRAFAAPWVHPDSVARVEQMSVEEIASAEEAVPPGVMTRQGTSLFYPPQIPDLIGLKDRRYFDHTGLVRHRAIGDLMRYSAINQGGDDLARYGDFMPIEVILGKLPEPTDPRLGGRYSDEQLYALALYLYSLEPPPNPNKSDALAARGQKLFEREGCAMCHTPPLYTNNMLTPVGGFTPPEDHLKKFHILPISVGADPNLALKTRRGTGYYKIPSLKGVWYRGPLEHNGSVATLEDWFDPRRTRDDYVPTGFRGFGVKSRAVKGHAFGLELSEAERKALIAFLKTL